MIFEYTPEEQRQWNEMDKYYMDQEVQLLTEAISNSNPPENFILDGNDENLSFYRLNKDIFERYNILDSERTEKEYLLRNQFEQAHFNELGGDPDLILKNGKEQIDLIIKEDYDSQIKLLQWLATNTNREINEIIKEDPRLDPRLTKKAASSLIDKGIHLHFDFLKKNFPKQYAALKRYKYNYLKNSLLVIQDEPIEKGGVPQKRQVPQLPESQKDLFKSDIITVLGGSLTDVLYNLSVKSFPSLDILAGGIRKTTINGIEVTIEGCFPGDLGTSTLKIWDAIIAYLAANNKYGIKSKINTTVEIPLNEYAEARKILINPRKMPTEEEQAKENRNAQDRKKKFKQDIRRDLDRLSKFRLTGREKKGKKAEDYSNLVLVYPDHKIENDVIRVHVPEDTAKYLLNSYPMFYAPELQGLNDTNPNAYRIGRAIYHYNSIDRNARRGTNTTLKVSTLISFTNHIPTMQDLENRRQRNWQDKIKKPLETVFTRLIESGIMLTWHYEDAGKEHKEISPKDAEKLSLNAYWNLNVKFQLKENKPQQERLEKLETKAKKKAARGTNRGERGRNKRGNEVGTNGGTR